MEMMSFTEIKRNPNITVFSIKRNAGNDWNVFFTITVKTDNGVYCEENLVKTQRGQARDFKTLDNAVRFVESCGKTNKVTVLFD